LIILKDEKDDSSESGSEHFETRVKIKDFRNKTEDIIDINSVSEYFDQKVITKSGE